MNMANPALPDFGARLLADESRCLGQAEARFARIRCVDREKCLRFVQHTVHDVATPPGKPVSVVGHLCADRAAAHFIPARWPRAPLTAPDGSPQPPSPTATPSGASSRSGAH